MQLLSLNTTFPLHNNSEKGFQHIYFKRNADAYYNLISFDQK